MAQQREYFRFGSNYLIEINSTFISAQMKLRMSIKQTSIEAIEGLISTFFLHGITQQHQK